MSFYNGILNHDDIHGSGQTGQRGLPGVGFKLDANGNYDIENKKLTNVKNGDMDHDVMVKSQIEGYVSNQMGTKADLLKTSTQTFQGRVQVPDFNSGQHSGSDIVNLRYIDGLFLNKKTGGTLSNPITFLSSLPNNQKQIYNLGLPQFNSSATNKQYVDNNFLNRLTGGQIGGDLDMRGHSIKYLKFDKDGSAAARVAELNTKADKSDFDDYFKLDGTKAMTGNLQMNGNHISGLTNLPNADDQATNKQYVDNNIRKANIKPSHTPKNVFKYLMNDVNEWSSEYNIKVLSFSDLVESPHSWDKRVLNITPVKDGKNYRFRFGLQMFPMKTNESYSLIIELYNRDFKTWQRQETYINGTGVWVENSNTTKFQHRYGSSGDLYYTKTLVKFKKTSSSAPVFVYYTVHFDDKGGDMNTYPKDFKNQVYIVAYGVIGEIDHVDSEVYDAHQAYEIDKTKMKMFVSLDMNNNKIENLDDPLNEGDACNKRSLNIVETKLNDLSHYTKDYIYRTIFGNDFYDLEETSMFNLVQDVSGVVISGLQPNLVLGTDRFINSYSPKYGLQLSMKSHIRTTKIFNQNTSFTFFMSFLHDTTKTCEISWSNTLNIHIKFYPRYQITNNKLKIVVPAQDFETIFTSDVQNKQNFVWICYDSSKNLYKFSLSNYSSRVQQTFVAPVNFQSMQLEIDYDGYVKKVGLIDKFIDIDSLEFHKIILEEKRNGVYLE